MGIDDSRPVPDETARLSVSYGDLEQTEALQVECLVVRPPPEPILAVLRYAPEMDGHDTYISIYQCEVLAEKRDRRLRGAIDDRKSVFRGTLR